MHDFTYTYIAKYSVFSKPQECKRDYGPVARSRTVLDESAVVIVFNVKSPGFIGTTITWPHDITNVDLSRTRRLR